MRTSAVPAQRPQQPSAYRSDYSKARPLSRSNAPANTSAKRHHSATAARGDSAIQSSQKRTATSVSETASPVTDPVSKRVRHDQYPTPQSTISSPEDAGNRRLATDTNALPKPFHPFGPPELIVRQDNEDGIRYLRQTSTASGSPETYQDSHEASLITALGAGRLDPFQVYCKQDLPLYVHAVLDHYLNYVCCSFTLASRPVDLNIVKRFVMGNAMSDPLTWYTIILAGVTHYIFSNSEKTVPKEYLLLRLSYKTQAMIEIRKEVERRNGQVTEPVLFAINTLAAHGGAEFDKGFRHDRIQASKALGHANAMQYYSTVDIEWEHWDMMTRLVRQRGGPGTLSHPHNIRGFPPSPGPGCLTTTDVAIAWRNLRCPEFSLVTSTDKVIDCQRLERDAPANDLMQKLLSGIPTMPKNSMHSRRMMTLLKHIRTLIVDFDQYQRGAAQQLDLRALYWVRLMLLHDLLLLPDLTVSDNPMDLVYELCRNCALAFQQLVLVPVVASNRVPEKILSQLIPLLRRCTTSIHGRTLDREHPSLSLWAVMLAGMLAMEHYLSHNDAVMLDQVSTFFDRVPIKGEKGSWPMVASVLKNFLWLESECEIPGRRYWNYACLWLADRARTESVAS